ncbi:MAG: DegV family protein [Roseburia sp.]|nr:DegV family protein [Roseburia sp.]
MVSFEIFTDSCCDLPKELVEKCNLQVMQLEVNIDGKPPILNKDVESKVFYEQLRAGANAKTNAVTLGYFEDHMRKSLEEGKDIIYLGFSGSLSATYNNGVMMMQELQEEYPERKLLHVDTLCASVGQGLLVYHAAELRDAGATIDEVFEKIMALKDYIHHVVTVDDLFFLKRGGRLSAVSAIAGSMLKVKPIILINEDGRLNNVATIRGRKNALKDLYERMKNSERFAALPYVFISHADCIEDAKYIEETMRVDYPEVKVVISDIGPVIGAHTGPGGLAICFLGKTIKGQ